MAEADVPVVIIGGSLVGLSTAVFLAAQGIPSLVVERHPGTAIHPRAALVSQRTVELFRTLGMQPEIESAAAAEFVQNGAIISVESLGGKELAWYFRSINEGVEDLSPAPRLFVTQIGLEPILRRHAEAGGARLEYSCEAVELEQDDDGVTVHLRDRGGAGERTVRARYVVAADGAKSPMRERLGVRTQGHGSFSDSITIYFRADVRALIGDRNLSVIYVFHPRLTGFFRFSLEGDAGFLVVNSTVDEDGVRSTSPGEDMSEQRCIEYVRQALGDPDIEVEIESVQRWSSMADWAERLPRGACLLRRRRGARHAPDGRLRRQLRRARCRQPGLEAGGGPARRRRPGPPVDLRRRATARLGVHGRAGLHPLRASPRPRSRSGRPDADRRRGHRRAGLSLPLRRRRARGGRGRRALGEPARTDGEAWLARAAPRVRRPGRRHVDARPRAPRASSCSPGRKDRSGATRRRLRPRLWESRSRAAA